MFFRVVGKRLLSNFISSFNISFFTKLAISSSDFEPSSILSICVFMLSCKRDNNYIAAISDPVLFQESVQNLTDIIVHDIFSPPVASRVYLYPTIAAYEIVAQFDSLAYQSFAGKLSGLEPIPSASKNVNPHLAAIYAFNSTGKALIFSEDKMQIFQEKQNEKIRKIRVPKLVRKASKLYADQVSKHILSWAKDDMYDQTPPSYDHWLQLRKAWPRSARDSQAPLSIRACKPAP